MGNVTILARRWDGLGGRLTALLNAISVAEALGVEYCFKWPPTKEWGFQHPKEIFSEAYLEKKSPDRVTIRKVLQFSEISNLPRKAALQWCRDAQVGTVIEIGEISEILKFSDETIDLAEKRFSDAFWRISWSTPISVIIAKLKDKKQAAQFATLHLRCGDIIHGYWRQFVPIEKYTPIYLIEYFLKQKMTRNETNIVILSDSQVYAEDLKCISQSILLPHDIVDDYHNLTLLQQTLCDVVIMGSSTDIYGPNVSYFSGFAARLRGKSVVGFAELIKPVKMTEIFEIFIEGLEKQPDYIDKQPGQRTARDICWFLEVFGDHLSENRKLTWATIAQNHDPTYCAAINHRALTLASIGKQDEARELNNLSLDIASQAWRHHDPFTESLVTRALIESLSHKVLDKGGSNSSIVPSPIRGICSTALSVMRKVCRKYSLAKIATLVLFIVINKILKFSRAQIPMWLLKFFIGITVPYQIDTVPIKRNLSYHKLASQFLRSLTKSSQIGIKLSGHFNDASSIDACLWRLSRLEIFNTRSRFPETLLRAESLSIGYTNTLLELISTAQKIVRVKLKIFDIKVQTSASGLRWINVRFELSNHRQRASFVSLISNEKIVSAGFLQPTVVNGWKSNYVVNESWIPVPRSVSHISDADFCLFGIETSD